MLQAMAKVPRHHFAPSRIRGDAYVDASLPLGPGATIPPPYVIASTLAALELRGFERVLDVGAGSGYQTALLCELVSHVCAVEIVRERAQYADGRLSRLGYRNYTMMVGNGREGLPLEGPFDRIVVAAAAEEIPRGLVDQLEPGGRMLIPVGGPDGQVLERVTKRSDGTFTVEQLDRCACVPLLQV